MSGRNILGSPRAKEVLTCRLCTQYLQDPRQLPCGHSFCLQCLERYYMTECRRSESGRLRSPSMERRHRGLLPCPAAPSCLHVAVVPDDGVASFPVNQKVADMKERVVNEMAYNISRRIGRPYPSGRGDEFDTASVCSDETDYSDISCETTSSAPAAAGSNHHPSRYPNLSKYAKYFDADMDGSSEKYRPSLRSERRRVAISSSFQHRRRRVETPSPAAFDDSTADLRSSHPDRCGSAPHLNSDEVSYRPTVRPRQGSSMASPLLRRAARPTSCILEELVDDQEFLNHVDETSPRAETPRRATSTERRHQPLFRDHFVLPTHRENISTDEERRSVPTETEPVRHVKHQPDDVKSGHTSGKTMPSQDERSSRYSRHRSENLESHGRSTKRVPCQDEPSRRFSGNVETAATFTSAKASHSEPNKREKHQSTSSGTDTAAGVKMTSSTNTTRNWKAQSDTVKTGKTSTSTSSQTGRRVLPTIPTNSSATETLKRADDVRTKTVGSGIQTHHIRQLPKAEDLASRAGHRVGSVGQQQKDRDMSKSSWTKHYDADRNASASSHSDPKKVQSSSSTISSNSGNQKSAVDSRPANVKSSSSDSVHSKSSSSKSHETRHSKSSVSGTKSSAHDSSSAPKSQDSRKIFTDQNASQSKLSSKSGRVNGTEFNQKTSQRAGHSAANAHGSAPSKSANKVTPPQVGAENKNRRARTLTGDSKSDKNQSPKSTPASGSRLTYKVNAATVQPVLMNSKKKNQDSPSQRSTGQTPTGPGTGRNPPHRHDGTFPGENEHIPTSIDLDSLPSSPTSLVSPDISPLELSEKQSSRQSSGGEHHFFGSTDVSPETHKCHVGDVLPKQPDGIPRDTDAAATDAKNEQKRKQWTEFMAILQASRSKYSAGDHRSSASEAGRPLPVISDTITPRWRMQRDDFSVPSSIALTSDGSAIIADVANCLLDFADVDGSVVHSVTGTKPFSVSVGPDDVVYVGDRRSRTVRVFDVYGSDVAQWDAESVCFGWIAGIAVLRNGQLAIVDRERCKVTSLLFFAYYVIMYGCKRSFFTLRLK